MLDARVTGKNKGARVQQMFKMLKAFTNMIFTNIQLFRIYEISTVKNHA